ncbi:MAG TPA: hypothetical protein VEU11_08800 [Terriglobales bacterium]|nr:hypothetical protein [Terriglobales bacterium]
MKESFMVSDVIATSAAFFIFALFLFVPGYVCGWLADVFDFKKRSLLARFAISIPLSIGICPILTYLLWRWSLTAVWIAYGACWIAFVAMFIHDSDIWLSRPKLSRRATILLGIIVGWVALGMLCVVDLQIGNRLYLPTVAYDYMLRTAITSSITHTGIPPHNPYFFPGHPFALRYHYFWFILCSLVNQLARALVSPRQAMIASMLWSGVGLIALIPLYLRFFQPKGATNLEKRTLVGVALLGVTGLDIVPVTLYGLLGSHFLGSIEWWNYPIEAWISSVLWAPHHVAAFVASLTGFLVLWDASRERSSRHTLVASVIAGIMFASAAGISVYVAFVFAAFLAIWLAITLWKGHREEAAAICIAGMVALAVSIPFLVELIAGHFGQRSASGPFVQFAIRRFTVAEAVVEAIWPGKPWLVPVTNLLLLRMNYLLELGFFFQVGLMMWRKMRLSKDFLNQKELCGFTMAATSVAICTFLRSGVISNDDLGYRGFLLAQFILLIWAADLWDDGLLQFRGSSCPQHQNVFSGRRRRLHMLVLIVLGAVGSLYEVVMVRFYYAGPSISGERTAALRQVYEDLKRRLPEKAVVQQNPNAVPGDVFYGLYADRQAGVETPECGVVFGGDPDLCRKVIASVDDLFEKPEAIDQNRVDPLCRLLSIDAVVVKDSDKAWSDKNSWVWKKQPILANNNARVFLCGGRLNIGVTAKAEGIAAKVKSTK